mmetsp:Transcript_55879/g.130530  ORF Transcript_55879/g.130530 Transcript_55879/m.130530 type:complete len:91 (-) Transcript_55879:681-953(-)
MHSEPSAWGIPSRNAPHHDLEVVVLEELLCVEVVEVKVDDEVVALELLDSVEDVDVYVLVVVVLDVAVRVDEVEVVPLVEERLDVQEVMV